jgi:hypothetical protein
VTDGRLNKAKMKRSAFHFSGYFWAHFSNLPLSKVHSVELRGDFFFCFGAIRNIASLQR